MESKAVLQMAQMGEVGNSRQGGEYTRRQFLSRGAAALLAIALGLPAETACSEERRVQTPARLLRSPTQALREAMHYRRLGDGQVQCEVCFRQCMVEEGRLGFCRSKKNINGVYYSLIYGQPCALQVDPIEKEPVFHMLPGSKIFCVGTASCNSRCRFCQNWEMSQRSLWETLNYPATPAEVVKQAQVSGCTAISFTYNEPTVFYEYMYDIACLAQEAGLRTLCHTNGTLLAASLQQLLSRLDAITVDLKAFTAEFYQRVCTLDLSSVLATLKRIAASGVHLEVVNLLIPGLNDDRNDVRRMCDWMVQNLGADVPLHFIRFFPAYKMQHVQATPIETLEAAAAEADETGLNYVYIGNVPGHERNSTFCPACGERVIHRQHFAVLRVDVVSGRCRFCGQTIPGVWAAETAGSARTSARLHTLTSATSKQVPTTPRTGSRAIPPVTAPRKPPARSAA